MKNKLKSEKGVTLTTLVIYIIVLVVALGILATVSTFFYKNVILIKDSAKYAAEFDKFNASFIKEVALDENSILIVGDRYKVIEHAIKQRVKLIILAKNRTIPKKLLSRAKRYNINIIRIYIYIMKSIII